MKEGVELFIPAISFESSELSPILHWNDYLFIVLLIYGVLNFRVYIVFTADERRSNILLDFQLSLTFIFLPKKKKNNRADI